MLKIFVASKNPILPAYLLLFLKEFAEGQDFTLVSDKKAKTDLVIIDTETISAKQSKSIISGRSVI